MALPKHGEVTSWCAPQMIPLETFSPPPGVILHTALTWVPISQMNTRNAFLWVFLPQKTEKIKGLKISRTNVDVEQRRKGPQTKSLNNGFEKPTQFVYVCVCSCCIFNLQTLNGRISSSQVTNDFFSFL